MSVPTEESDDQNPHEQEKDVDTRQFLAFLRTALMPMLILKSFLLYFGLNYSSQPGEGYGWGLAATLTVSVASFSWFIWSQTRSEE